MEPEAWTAQLRGPHLYHGWRAAKRRAISPILSCGSNGLFTFYLPTARWRAREYEMGLKSGVWQRYDEWGQRWRRRSTTPTAQGHPLHARRDHAAIPGGQKQLVTYLRQSDRPMASTRTERPRSVSWWSATATLSESRCWTVDNDILTSEWWMPDGSPPWTPGRKRPARARADENARPLLRTTFHTP
jgi:hypothetical protein